MNLFRGPHFESLLHDIILLVDGSECEISTKGLGLGEKQAWYKERL